MMRCFVGSVGPLVWALVGVATALAPIPEPTRTPRSTVVDLDVGATTELELLDGKPVKVRVLELNEKRDTVRKAVRHATVMLEVNGERGEVASSVYHLPVTLGGVQVDVPITKGRYEGVSGDPWALKRDVRLRV